MDQQFDKLRQCLQQELPLSNIDPLAAGFSTFRHLKKGEHLVRPGEKTTFLAFICNGAFRIYYYDNDGDQVTTWFSYGEMFITDLESFINGKAAMRYIDAIENSEILMIDKSTLERLYLNYPEYLEFGRKIAERWTILLMKRMLSLQTKSAKERYRDLLNQPQFMRKIPLKYLASYLGIKDTSLSRIRKNLT